MIFHESAINALECYAKHGYKHFKDLKTYDSINIENSVKKLKIMIGKPLCQYIIKSSNVKDIRLYNIIYIYPFNSVNPHTFLL